MGNKLKRWTDKDFEKVDKLLSQGKKQAEVAAALGVTRSSLKGALDRHKLREARKAAEEAHLEALFPDEKTVVTTELCPMCKRVETAGELCWYCSMTQKHIKHINKMKQKTS